jgi:hypothetical protein
MREVSGVEIIVAALVGFIGFAKKLGESARIWDVEVVPFWIIALDLVFIGTLLFRLKPRTELGGTLVIVWSCALALPFIVAIIIATFLMLMGYAVGQPK